MASSNKGAPSSASYSKGAPPPVNVKVAGWSGESYRMNLGHKDPNYGTPMAGSKTDKRGKRAAVNVSNEILDLVEIIYRIGAPYPGCIKAVSFGHLFQVYTVISNKVVGILVRARRHGLVHFTGEMLYQGQDDNKIIMLLEIPESLFASLGLKKPEPPPESGPEGEPKGTVAR